MTSKTARGSQASYSDIDNANYDGEPVSSVTTSPLIEGISLGPGGPIGFDVNADSVKIRNFWVTRCQFGVSLVGANNCTVENVYVWSTGDDSHQHYDGRGIILSNSKDNNVVRCVVYNGGQQAFTNLNKSHDNDFTFCAAYCDTDQGAHRRVGSNPVTYVADENGAYSHGATHYYFIVDDSNGVTFSTCAAERHPDPVKPLVNGKPQMPRHEGHGFLFQADHTNETTEVTDCLVENSTTLNIAEPVFLRRSHVHGNCFVNITSTQNIADERDDPVGCLTFSGAPHSNEFHRIRLNNSDVAVAMFGWKTDGGSDGFGIEAARHNLFMNCDFECEIAIRLSDFSDERDGLNSNGNLTDGCKQIVANNLFWHCDFVGDPNYAANTFFESSREADDNLILSSAIFGFDFFSEESSYGPNQPVTPYSLTGSASGFKFNYCMFTGNSTTFWEEDPPGGGAPISFDEDDLGIANLVSSSPVDKGFIGDWNDDGDVDSSDLIFLVPNYPVAVLYHPFPVDDLDGDNVRTDAAPDIGAREFP